MDGKTVILSVFIMSLVMSQNQVQGKACCPSIKDHNHYIACFFAVGGEEYCARKCGCTIVDETCPAGFTHFLENSGNAVNEYCKLGCVSSVCGALKSLQKSDASEFVNGAVEKCTNACSTLCTNGSKIALKTA